MTTWKCEKCGYKLEAEAPPEQCPVCHANCEFIDASCYTPDCASGEPDGQIGKDSV
ncbi:MAG: hypothetical protein JRH15_01330 [Deltaproteobacteria bacterium]|nr:hypothetical protein [Deltaproteobacteria bacterium]